MKPAGATRAKKCWLLERDIDDHNRWWAVGPNRDGTGIEFGSPNLRLYREITANPPDGGSFDEIPELDH